MSSLVKVNYNKFNQRGYVSADPKSQNIEFLKFCVKAFEEGQEIIIELNKDWEDYSGLYKEATEKDNFQIIVSVGISNGTEPVLLALKSSLADGGSVLFTHKDAIASYRVATAEDELYRTLKRLEELYDMTLFDFMDEFKDEHGDLKEKEYIKYSNLLNEIFR